MHRDIVWRAAWRRLRTGVLLAGVGAFGGGGGGGSSFFAAGAVNTSAVADNPGDGYAFLCPIPVGVPATGPVALALMILTLLAVAAYGLRARTTAG
jgi:hypothetical protein